MTSAKSEDPVDCRTRAKLWAEVFCYRIKSVKVGGGHFSRPVHQKSRVNRVIPAFLDFNQRAGRKARRLI
jgi:hypothetical protein